MDPDEALRRLRNMCSSFGEVSDEEQRIIAEELVDHFAGLDEWISKGGFLPKAWRKGGE